MCVEPRNGPILNALDCAPVSPPNPHEMLLCGARKQPGSLKLHDSLESSGVSLTKPKGAQNASLHLKRRAHVACGVAGSLSKQLDTQT